MCVGVYVDVGLGGALDAVQVPLHRRLVWDPFRRDIGREKARAREREGFDEREGEREGGGERERERRRKREIHPRTCQEEGRDPLHMPSMSMGCGVLVAHNVFIH